VSVISSPYLYSPLSAAVCAAVMVIVITPTEESVIPDPFVRVRATAPEFAFLIGIEAVYPVKLIGVPEMVAVIVPGSNVLPCQSS